MLTFLLWLQQIEPPSRSWWTSPEARSAMLGVVISMGGFVLAFLKQALKRLGEVRDDLREVKRDLHGTPDAPGLIKSVRLNTKRIDAIEDRNIAIDAVVEAERQQWPYPDRRAGPRRLKDVVREVEEERQRRAASDEYPIEDPTDE